MIIKQKQLKTINERLYLGVQILKLYPQLRRYYPQGSTFKQTQYNSESNLLQMYSSRSDGKQKGLFFNLRGQIVLFDSLSFSVD